MRLALKPIRAQAVGLAWDADVPKRELLAEYGRGLRFKCCFSGDVAEWPCFDLAALVVKQMSHTAT